MNTNQAILALLPSQEEIFKDTIGWKKKVIDPNLDRELLIHLCKNVIDYELWKELSYLSHLPLEGQAALIERMLTTRVKAGPSISTSGRALTYFATFSSFQVEALKMNTEVILSLDPVWVANIVSSFGKSTRVPGETINALWDILLLLPERWRDRLLDTLPSKKLTIDRLIPAITDRTYNLQKLAIKRKREVMEYCSELSGTDVSKLPESWIPNMLGWNWNWT